MTLLRRVAVLFLAILLLAGNVQAQDVGIAIGSLPPPVTIEDLDGQPVDLSQYVGKRPVLLEFWAEWCPLCKALEPRLRAAQEAYAGKVEVIRVAVAVNESRSSIKRYLEKQELPGLILWDTSGRAVRAYQAPSTSYVVTLDATGRVAYTGVGSDQDLNAAMERALVAR